MKIFSLLLFLLLLPLLATRGGQSTYPATGPGRQAYGGTPAAPTAPHAACFTMGAATTYTTGSVNTTGSNTIVAIVSYFNAGTIATVVDNGTSTTLTTPLSTTIATGDNAIQISHELSPSSTSSSETFTITTATGDLLYGYVCIVPFVGLTGNYDSNMVGATSTGSTCATSAITPSHAVNAIVAGVSSAATGTMTLSGFTIVGQVPYSGTNFAAAGAYAAQAAATAQTPSWGGLAASNACQAGSYY